MRHYFADGTLDVGFGQGTGAISMVDRSVRTRIVLDSDGSLVFGSGSTEQTGQKIALHRVSADGAHASLYETDLASPNWFSLAIDGDAIVASGWNSTANETFIIRHHADLTPGVTFGAAGYLGVKSGVAASTSIFVSITSDGGYVLSGSGNGGIAISRILRDAPEPGSISGTVFHDANDDGIFDVGEQAIAGATLFIDCDSDLAFDLDETSVTTDSNGGYIFAGLLPGTYSIVQLPAGSFISSADNNVVQVGAGEAVTGVDFANLFAAPAVTPPVDQLTIEGLDVWFQLGSFSDPAGSDSGPWTITVAWGDHPDNVSSAITSSAGDIDTLNHVYDDNGTYTVTVTVANSFGATSSATFGVDVAGVAPTAGTIIANPVTEGSIGAVIVNDVTDASGADTAAGFFYSFDFDNDGTFDVIDSTSSSVSVPASYLSDNGTRVVAIYSYDFNNDGVFDVVNSTSAIGTVPSQYMTDGPGVRRVRATITDKDGGSRTYFGDVTITNTAPTVSVSGPTSARINSNLTYTFTANDALAADRAGNFTFRVDWNNDGVIDQTVTGLQTTKVSRRFTTAGTHTFKVWAIDKDGGMSSAVACTVQIR